MKQHFVTFLSPGTLVAEQSTKPIKSWSVDTAVEMARDINERHGATPYGFYFSTRERRDDELDSQRIAKSGMHYLGGKVLTVADLRAEGNPNNRILISNMECNGWDRVVRNGNSWRWTQPLGKGDVVLPFDVDSMVAVAAMEGK